MTKKHRVTTISTEDAFHRHYAAIWGNDRWRESLYPALLRPTRYVCLLNRYTYLPEDVKRIVDDQSGTLELSLPRVTQIDGSSTNADSCETNCYIRVANIDDDRNSAANSNGASLAFPPPVVSLNGLMSHWNLDAASVLVAHILNVQPGENVLDLCAAPGGKSIAVAQRLWPHLHADDSPLKRAAADTKCQQVSILHSNEAGSARQRRLAENIRAYLPKALFDGRKIVTSRIDGAKPNVENWFRVKTLSGTTGYDKVLVDAPCSSERHIIHAHSRAQSGGKVTDEMAGWRPGLSKRLVSAQVDLLLTGLNAAKVGGTVVYATCSIEQTENDGVVGKALAHVEKERKKRGQRWRVAIGFNKSTDRESLEADLKQNWAEPTRYGWIVLPDHPSGGQWGPLYFAILNKVEMDG